MLITTGGILVRTRVSEIREMGRSTQGVKLINVDEGTVLSGLQRISESMDEDDLNSEDDAIVGQSELNDENNPPSDTNDESPTE
jgi:DNA gyrase subunit A